jgi:hypothetical protein
MLPDPLPPTFRAFRFVICVNIGYGQLQSVRVVGHGNNVKLLTDGAIFINGRDFEGKN